MQVYQLRIKQLFKELFHKPPQMLVRAPGRINLLGEHTDYNGGLVLPAAIDKALCFAVSKRDDGQCRLYAENFLEGYTFLGTHLHKEGPAWTYYIKGVLAELDKLGAEVGGFDMVFGGDIPLGAGLSSSAALECGIAFALNELYALGLTKMQLIKLAQSAENNFVEVNCGIMDQFASMMGKKDAVIKLDCNTLAHEYYSIHLDNYDILLCDSGIKHNLGDSEYNTRRKQCEQGVASLSKHYTEVQSLRDVSYDMLLKYKDELSTKVFDRCAYVIEEISRVNEACVLLENSQLADFGKMMYETHNGLRYLYEVSCKELDFLVDYTTDKEYVLGARMMGGGFGGCTINIVAKEESVKFTAEISRMYKEQFGISLKVYSSVISDGVGFVDEN